jgi:hypothetical protein
MSAWWSGSDSTELGEAESVYCQRQCLCSTRCSQK